ncbi:MAG: hypothetical protein L0211_08230 [Planctomycetaceae bacterium]|nr:hypothetical protein [Planctomycetaceae bacterium]
MTQKLKTKFTLPEDWRRFKMPSALERRLQSLLDKQDSTGKLSAVEREEAEALVELSEMFSRLKIRARSTRGKERL